MHCSAKRGIATACRLSVCLSVALVDQERIRWKSWKLIAGISKISRAPIYRAHREVIFAIVRLSCFTETSLHAVYTVRPIHALEYLVLTRAHCALAAL